MNKILKITGLVFGLGFSTSMVQAADISAKFICSGPGFAYAELELNSIDVGLPTQASTLSLSHFYFELTPV